MIALSPRPLPRGRKIRLALLVLVRAAGLVLFALGLAAWIRLVGIYDAPGWRFDLMTLPWRIATPLLAVLYPIAGVGLWMAVSWGVVVWVLIAAVEATMHLGFSNAFGPVDATLTFHVLGLLTLLTLHLAHWWRLHHPPKRRPHG